MHQQSLAAAEFEKFCKTTRKETFLAEMDNVIPWKELCEVIEPFIRNPLVQAVGR